MKVNTLSLLLKDIAAVNSYIQEAKKKLEGFKVTVEMVDAKIASLQPLANPSLVKSSSTAQANLEHTKYLLTEIKLFDSSYASLVKYIKKSTEEKTTKHLLSIYKELKAIENLKGATPAITEKLATLKSAFSILVFTLVDSLVEIIKKDGPAEYLKIAKIVDKEEPLGTRYKEKTLETFLDSIERKFRETVEEKEGAPGAEKLQFVIEDVKALKTTEELALPERHRIFSFGAIHYHRALYEYLEKHCDNFDPSESIGILMWTRHYYSEMKKLGKAPGALGPPLFAGKEKHLVERYIAAAKEKLTAWISNIAQKEAARFRERKKAPDLDKDNKFISVGFMDLLHIIKQQVTPIYEHDQIFREITKHVLWCVGEFKNTLAAAMESELELVHKDKAQSGFEEYLIAMGNSGLKFMECLKDLPFYANTSLQAIGGVFYECFLFANSVLIKNIFFVIKKALKKVFTKDWAVEPVADTIISTFKDYIADYKEIMIDHFFYVFVAGLFQQLGTSYVDRVCKKNSVFLKEHIELLNTEKKKYSYFFWKYLPKDVLSTNMRYFDLFIAVASTENLSLCVSETKTFASLFPKEGAQRIRCILKKMPGGGKEYAEEVLKRANITE